MSQNNNDQIIKDALSEVLGGVAAVDPATPDPAAQAGADPTEDDPNQAGDGQGADPNQGTEDAPADPPATPATTEPNPAPQANTDLFAQHFADLGIKDIEEAKKIVKESTTLLTEYETAKTELEKASAEIQKLKTTPHFADENERRAFEWVKQYKTLDKRAFDEHKMLDEIDPSTIGGKKAMEIDYVLSKKHLSPSDAVKRFEYEYNKKYTLDEMASEEDREMARIDREEAEYEAKEKLVALKNKYGTVEQQPQTPEQKASELALQRSVGETLTNWDGMISGTKDFAFKRGQDEVRVEVGEEERKVINQIVRPILENKANYDQNGKLKYNVGPLLQREMKILLFDKLVEKVETNATNKAKEEAMRSITSRQPDIDRQNQVTPPASASNTVDNMGSAILNKIN
jgi:hypothetical protein